MSMPLSVPNSFQYGLTRQRSVFYHPHKTYSIWWVKSVPRLRADLRISAKKRSGPTHHIEFLRQYWVRWDGKYSTKLPVATASQIAEHIRRWRVANA